MISSGRIQGLLRYHTVNPLCVFSCLCAGSTRRAGPSWPSWNSGRLHVSRAHVLDSLPAVSSL